MAPAIPTGSYVIMNAQTQTYLNVLGYQTDIVNSVGNHLGNDIWNVASTEACGTTIQSYGTGAFLTFDQANKADTPNGSVVTGNSIHPWVLQQNSVVPYAWNITDMVTGNALVVQGNSVANGAQVLEECDTINQRCQAWFFIAKEPIPGTN
ncbi:hypothetical protein EV702DRAFT_1197545 [Suillus placidus]|uniref:Ricin B lectin domain-containing protein n=1 Tax=Suillus placidus TaxID=48579 RepID=A0A9P6ZUX9_9AGAM|nr:hypothetical protein EV702DRAFT_1197545 [Suillus placidus]